MFGGTRLGYRLEEDANGARVVRIVELALSRADSRR
jgi:hypothetical protein